MPNSHKWLLPYPLIQALVYRQNHVNLVLLVFTIVIAIEVDAAKHAEEGEEVDATNTQKKLKLKT